MWKWLTALVQKMRKKRRLSLLADAGAFIITGFDSVPRRLRISFTNIYQLAANAGAFALTGKAATLSSTHVASGSLASLAPNTARNLGTYYDPDPQFLQSGGTSPTNYNLQPWDITDFSGLAMDVARNRVLIYGGGHGTSQQTNVRQLDLSTLTFSNVAASTPASYMINHLDDHYDKVNGSWLDGQPGARHTYNMLVVRGTELLCMTPRGMPFDLGTTVTNDWTSFWGGRMPRFDFANGWSYSQYSSGLDQAKGSIAPFAPWSFQASACLDPVSNKVIVAGNAMGDSGGGIFMYDRDTDTATTGPTWPDGASVGHPVPCLVYFPPNDKFYCFVFTGPSFPVPLQVYEITVNRSSFALSTISPALVYSGSAPPAQSSNGLDWARRNGFAYDSVNGVIGGQPLAGTFYTFAPVTRVWTATTMQVEAGSSGTPEVGNNTLVFDPTSGCYLFIDHPGSGNSYPLNMWAYRPPQTQSQSAGVSDMSITLDFGGGSVATFSGTNAVDKGDYIGEFVRQKSYMVTNAAFPDWRVWFRVDANTSGVRIAEPATGWRDEVIVEYGRTTNGTPVNITSPYTATIRKSGTVVATYNVPYHFWFSRWRHQSSQRAVVRTPASLIARQWLPKFGTTGLYGRTADTIDVSWTGPFMAPTKVTTGNNGASSIWDTFQGNGGDHDELGLVTEQAGSYIIFSNANSLRTIRTQAEWCGNWAMHLRDDATGDMPSFRDTTTKLKSLGGTVNEVVIASPESSFPGFVDLDYNTGGGGSHWYANANLPWLILDDPFFLEELQFGVNLRMLYSSTSRAYFSLGGCMSTTQDRAFYWGLRDLFLLSKTCPASTPTWLRNQAFWAACLEDNRQVMLKYVNSPAAAHAIFHMCPRIEAMPAWEHAWRAAVIGNAVLAGFSTWQSIFDWCIQTQIEMTNGASGWNKQWPTPYLMSPVINGTYYNTVDQEWRPLLTTAQDANYAASWTDAWNFYKSGGGVGDGRPSYGTSDSRGITFSDSGWDGHTIMEQFPVSGFSYSGYFIYPYDTRCALAVATTIGTAGALACYNYIHGELSAVTNWGGTQGPQPGELRFCIDP